ncbi:hypothetical protein CCR75_009382 [Bremia lactucae]|uniref:FYVE-type domain-containing protein n=1 Tax=Bremia lactucae TaxID=4779 RepID=A0A976FHT6_BRELC|nr:hypothetical protein CCR75_009382 [Bremia lactucae]
MVSVRLQRQHQVSVNHRLAPESTPEDDKMTPPAAPKLAECSDFPRLLVALALRPQLAQTVDAFGMTALHWVCSDPKAPARVVWTVARVFPAAAATRNLAGLLPLHVAIRKRLALEVIQALLHVYPEAVIVCTPDGKTPFMLAKQKPVASSAIISLLRLLEAQAKTGAPILSPSRWAAKLRSRKNRDVKLSNGLSRSRMDTQEGTMVTRMAPRVTPPRWAMGSKCSHCAHSFGYFRQRHHCRNCGASVCGRHSRHHVPLKHLGLDQPQRVCTCCFDDVQAQYNIRALSRVTQAGGVYPYVNTSDTFTNDWSHSRPRHSKSIFSEPTQHGKPFEMATNRVHNARGNGFTPISVTSNWNSAATDTKESFQRTKGSMFLAAAPKRPTLFERQRLRDQPRQSTDSEQNRQKTHQRRPQSHLSWQDTSSLHTPQMSGIYSNEEHELDQQMQQFSTGKRKLTKTTRCHKEKAKALSEPRQFHACAEKYLKSGNSCVFEYEGEDEEAELAATMAFMTAGRRMSCTADLLEDLDMPSNVAKTHHEVGVNLMCQGEFCEAIVALQRSVKLDETNSVTWLDLAKALDGEGKDRESAEEAVRRALKLEPSSIGALSLLGKLLHLRGDHDDAILVFRQVLELQCPGSGHR